MASANISLNLLPLADEHLACSCFSSNLFPPSSIRSMDPRKLYELHQKHGSRCMQARILRQRVEQAASFEQTRRILQRLAAEQQAWQAEQARRKQQEQARLATEQQQAEKARKLAEAFACRRCPAKFPSNTKLHEHVRNHHAKKLKPASAPATPPTTPSIAPVTPISPGSTLVSCAPSTSSQTPPLQSQPVRLQKSNRPTSSLPTSHALLSMTSLQCSIGNTSERAWIPYKPKYLLRLPARPVSPAISSLSFRDSLQSLQPIRGQQHRSPSRD